MNYTIHEQIMRIPSYKIIIWCIGKFTSTSFNIHQYIMTYINAVVRLVERCHGQTQYFPYGACNL